MKIEFLGAHNTESQNTRLAGLLIDDVLALDAGSLTSSLSFERQLELKAVLITHQHYDHIKDIPLLGMTFYLNSATLDVYTTAPVVEAVSGCLLDGSIYQDFTKEPPEKPAIKLHTLTIRKEFKLEGYKITPLPVAHSVPSVGYRIISADGRELFYGGDNGPGLADCWQYISPQLLVMEVTGCNKYEQFGRHKQHMTPSLLREELLAFRKIRGFLPQVIAVHMYPPLEDEIKAELAAISAELGNPINTAYEGQWLEL
jgi:ribonuclease BN (tRNA processing enzyme)